MIAEFTYPEPQAYFAIQKATEEAGFSMPSERDVCALLQTLAASKPAGTFLELGTGTGLSTAWILEGMDEASTLISIDHEQAYLDIASENLQDERLKLICSDGEEWLKQNAHLSFDFIFADTWHGKYLMLDETLGMLNAGGFYIIDDMLPQANWPDGHQQKANNLIERLQQRTDFTCTKLNWSSGVILMVKRVLSNI